MTPARFRPGRRTILVVLIASVTAGAGVALWSARSDGFESVVELVDALNDGGVECALAFDPAKTKASIMRIPLTYEDGWCRMPDDERVFVRVYGNEDQARLYHSEVIGGGGRGIYLSDSNWELHAPSDPVADEIQDVIGGYR